MPKTKTPRSTDSFERTVRRLMKNKGMTKAQAEKYARSDALPSMRKADSLSRAGDAARKLSKKSGKTPASHYNKKGR